MASKANTPTSPKKTQAGTVSKMEAVRRAMAKLGNDAGRKEIHDLIKKDFGIVMSIDHVSTYRGDIRRKAAANAKAAAAANQGVPTPAKSAPVKPAVAATARSAAVKPSTASKAATGDGKVSEGISLKDIQAAKDLLRRIPVDELKTLLDLLAR